MWTSMHHDEDTSTISIGNVYAKLAERLDSNPEGRCFPSQICVNLLKEGKSAYMKVCNSFCNFMAT